MSETFTATRDQLVDAIAGCQPATIKAVNGVVKISAESMADAIIAGLARAASQPSITCPVCKMTSYHPEDIRQGYCGNCHDFTGSPEGSRS